MLMSDNDRVKVLVMRLLFFCLSFLIVSGTVMKHFGRVGVIVVCLILDVVIIYTTRLITKAMFSYNTKLVRFINTLVIVMCVIETLVILFISCSIH